MCLVLTAFAAVISTVIWYIYAPNNKFQLGTLSLMYWGATLMWTIDGFFCIAEGEPFLDLSANDALLGVVIILCGLVAWMLILLIKDPKNVISTFHVNR